MAITHRISSTGINTFKVFVVATGNFQEFNRRGFSLENVPGTTTVNIVSVLDNIIYSLVMANTEVDKYGTGTFTTYSNFNNFYSVIRDLCIDPN